jgi:L-arabinose isomerase
VFDRNCGSDDNLDITFDDESTSAIVCGSPTIGTYQSGNTPLSNFDELSAAGTWLIEIYDYHIGDTGILNDYSIEICSESSLNTGDIELDNLRIFPNPNNGSFTIGFNTRTGKNVSVQVYDIRGRMIYKNNYTTNIRFEEVISLTNTQSGIYLLQISDGLQKITKKIVVN